MFSYQFLDGFQCMHNNVFCWNETFLKIKTLFFFFFLSLHILTNHYSPLCGKETESREMECVSQNFFRVNVLWKWSYQEPGLGY